jgi:hypothetical protein
MLVLQPSTSAVIDWMGAVVGVSLGGIVATVAVDEGVSVKVNVTVIGVITTAPGVAV